MHHEAILGFGKGCPVRALGRRVVNIRHNTNNMNAFLCPYWDDVGRGNVTDNIRYAVKFVAKALNYSERGIPPDRIDTHSLQSGGACALALTGFKDREIMKMG